MKETNLIRVFPGYSTSYVIDIYNNGKISEYVYGNKSIIPKIEKANRLTLYDIASLTKVFTSVLVYIAYEEKKLNLNSYIYDIDNNFINLKNIRIIDLLSHNQNIWTDGYLESANNKNKFYKILYSAYVKEKTPTYVDTHYIILSTILEKVYNKTYKELCIEKIFNKLGLKNTTFDPDKSLCASNNYEHKDSNIVDYIYPGLIHDTKGRIAKSFDICLGHASIFTTGQDLLTFFKSFLDRSLLKKDTIDFMMKHKDMNLDYFNRLREIIDGNDINEMYNKVIKNNPDFYLPKCINNMGVSYKNEINLLNDVPINASKNTITFSGYTGPLFIIDFDKSIIIVVMCNSIHNSRLTRKERKEIEVKLTNYVYDNFV